MGAEGSVGREKERNTGQNSGVNMPSLLAKALPIRASFFLSIFHKGKNYSHLRFSGKSIGGETLQASG